MGEITNSQKIIFGIIAIIVIGVVILFVIKTGQNSGFIEINSNEVGTNSSEIKKSENEITIHIAGYVTNPGIVKLEEGARIQDAIEKAGGELLDADLSNVNLAYKLEDGQKIYIPGINEEDEEKVENNSYITKESGNNVIVNNSPKEENGTVNINTATQVQLEQIPGVGPSIAAKIVQYRKENGKFKTKEDIKNVSGIGDSKYETMKNNITV